MIRTRFAPSPTGPLHMGGVRTALYNYLFSKKHGGTFILRVEDTDQTRFVPGAEHYIIDTLKWCGIEPNEGQGFGGGEYGPYRQSERKDSYKAYAQQLVESGHAYYAFDTPDELDAMRARMKAEGNHAPQYNAVTRQYMKNSLTLPREETQSKLEAGEPFVIRIKMPRNEEIRFHDEIRGWVVFHTSKLDDKILLKGDGMPTYHLANVVDDHKMKITHVIRGEEWLPSAPLHVIMYRFFGWEATMPKFAHLPLILRPDGNGKLSKRDGDRLGFPVFPLNWKDPQSGEQSVGYKERGFFPEAFLNMLALLGWNPGTHQEIFQLSDLVEQFSIERVNKSGARFDFEKAKWFNQQFILKQDDATLVEMLRPLLKANNWAKSDEFLLGFVKLMQERAIFLNDFIEDGYYFFENELKYDEKNIKKRWKPNSLEIVSPLIKQIEAMTEFGSTKIESTVKSYLETNGFGFGQVLPALRLAVTGTMQGPPIFETMELLGKKEVVNRLNTAMKRFEEIKAQQAAS